MPCQDSPSAKVTYRAVVLAPQPLVALMSAVPTKGGRVSSSGGDYQDPDVSSMPAFAGALFAHVEQQGLVRGGRTFSFEQKAGVAFGFDHGALFRSLLGFRTPPRP